MVLGNFFNWITNVNTLSCQRWAITNVQWMILNENACSFLYKLKINISFFLNSDYVPLRNTGNTGFVYFRNWCLTLIFIMSGLIIFASSFNWLVLYIRNLNSEDNIKKRLRLKQKKKQMQQKMLIGDVISGN